MSKAIPTVQKYMTTSPHSIGQDQPIAFARAIMREHHIRHLPVLSGGHLVGMITERDIALVEGLKGVDPEVLKVEEAMSTQTYKVSPEAPLDEVVREMASKKYGSAIVEQNNKIVGIITTVDVCQALADLLHSRLSK
jgi:acetoin utilization protein AcuB